MPMPDDLFVELHGLVRAHFDVRACPSAGRFLRTHYHRYVVDAPSGPPNIVVTFGRLPAGDGGPRTIEWTRRHKGLARWRTRIEDVATDPIRVRVDANRFGALFFIGRVFSTLVRTVFLRHGFAAVHAAGLAGADRGVLLPAEQGTGKTLMSFVFLKHGYRLLGDDTVYLGPGGKILGLLFPVTVRRGRGLEELITLGRGDRLRLALRGMVGTLTAGYYELMTVVPPHRMAPDRLAETGHLTDICHLVRREAFEDLGPVGRDEMIDLLVANEEATNPDARDLIRRAGEIAPSSPLATFWTRYRQAIRDAVGPDIRCHRAAVPRQFSLPAFDRVVALVEGSG